MHEVLDSDLQGVKELIAGHRETAKQLERLADNLARCEAPVQDPRELRLRAQGERQLADTQELILHMLFPRGIP